MNSSIKDGFDMTISEQVYQTLLDELIPEYSVPWVEPIFIPGHSYYDKYIDALQASERLHERLGVADDVDVDTIINALLEHGRLLGVEMFKYGRIYQTMQDL